MSGYDGRTQGKRIRKPQAGNSNGKARWKYLSADVTDDVDKPVAKLQAKAHRKAIAKSTEKTTLKVGYDIDGDGFVDVREMRLAKFLDALLLDRRKYSDGEPKLSETELLAMRQSAGRLLIAREFVERNHERLWRYGAIFTGMTNEQAAELIARHKNFKKLLPFLESTERNRVVRSSHQMRNCIHGEVLAGAPSNAPSERQTWVETTRKLRSSSFTKHPLPDLQPKKKPVSPVLDPNQVGPTIASNLAASASTSVFSNAYGAIDIDGDGIVDDDEMKLHLRLQEATQSDDHDNNRDETRARHLQQFEGRKMMVADFVQRNAGQMWLYDASFRHKSTEQIVDEIASGAGFAAEFNRLRAKERLVKLKSSLGVSSCIVQLPLAALPTDPSNALEFRRVRDRPELLAARKELLKPLPQCRGTRRIREELAAADAVVGRSRSEGSLLIGLPRIYDTPIKIETIGSFSVTKWLLDN